MSTASVRVRALYATELRMLLRDRRTVMLSIVLPLVVMPIMLFASRWVEERRKTTIESREATYAVEGPRAAEARELVARAVGLVMDPGDDGGRPLLLREARVEDPARALEAGEIAFYVSATSAGAAPRGGAPTTPDEGDDDPHPLDLPGTDVPEGLLTLSVVYRADRDASGSVASRLVARLREVRRDLRHEALAGAGFTVARAETLPVESASVAGEGQVAGLALGRLLTILLMFLLFSGGSVVAQDTLAGEKERGTLETLLTTAAARSEIVTAKFLFVLTVAMIITVTQVLNLLVYVGFGLIPTSASLAAAVSPALALGLLLFFLPLAAFVAGVLLLASGYARSYREAQLYLLPTMLLASVPALAGTLPSVSLRSAIVMVPVANISVGVKEMLVGRVDWPVLVVAWLVTAAAAAYTMRLAARMLSTERLIVPSAGEAPERPGVPVMRLGRILTWYGVMWALLLLVSLNAGADFDIRLQLVVNLVGIFLGGSLLFIRRFRLDAAEALSLRMPPLSSWLAVAIGIPSGLLTGIGVFKLAQVITPVPKEVLESFGQQIMPESIPFWQLLPLMTILPGICEEIAFRGVLLHALRRHYRPLGAILLVGVAFGLFHMSLFRILQTAYLGVLFATATVLSGSIFPAMVWHASSNALALAAGRAGFPIQSLDASMHILAATALAVALWILWRDRRIVPVGGAASAGAAPAVRRPGR
jgi:ABC-type Na+ efflux pump permease subunit/membrane protease YdiL (CAAX protease family)